MKTQNNSFREKSWWWDQQIGELGPRIQKNPSGSPDMA
jgi:hypothetical protein